MAKANERPVIDTMAGLAALEEDLPRVLDVLGATSIESLGWSRPSKLALHIPMKGTFSSVTDEFLLRLGFQAYRAWPPSAQFINPATGTYTFPQDTHHVPRLTSNECQTHTGYDRPGGGKVQLICCSATFEFYDVLHGVDAHHIWKETNTFLTTLRAIDRAMQSSYQGRFAPDGK